VSLLTMWVDAELEFGFPVEDRASLEISANALGVRVSSSMTKDDIREAMRAKD
jgi:hypothetical protein